MLTVRKAEDRGHANHGWLDSRFTFSFSDYYDPAHMGFRALRVINDDHVQAGTGFGMHPHRDMEILTYVLEGAVAHKDSMGSSTVIRPGEVQRMTAGTGVLHSEFNPNANEGLHLLQIWIEPAQAGLKPGYEQKAFPPEELSGKLRLVADPRGDKGAVTVHQDVRVYAVRLDKKQTTELPLAKGRHAWAHVARGEVTLNGQRLKAGDGAALSNEPSVKLEGENQAEVLLFDLA